MYPDGESYTVPIVGDGAIAAANWVNGSLVAVLLLDLTSRPDVLQAIKAHSKYDDGDYKFAWGKALRNTIGLRLNLIRPLSVTIDLFFDPVKHHSLIDLMIQSRAVYLRDAIPGDNMMTSSQNFQLLLGLPHTGFEEIWEKRYLQLMTKKIRKHNGGSRRAAAKLAVEAIAEMRGLGSIRINPGNHDGPASVDR